jgi:hypothetical protein
MAYVKNSTWVEAAAPGMSAARLNNLETQYDEVLASALTFAALKTFTTIPVLPASNPTTDNQAVRKAYADSLGVRGAIVSDTLKHSNDTLRIFTSATYIKVKEILLNVNMSPMRLKFNLGAGAGNIAYGQIYKNGVAIGTERSVNGTETTFSEDFSGWVAGDLIQIYAKRTSGSGSTYVQLMKLYYDINLTSLFGNTLSTPLLTTTVLTAPTNQDP